MKTPVYALTMNQLAKSLGLSRTTVSLVLKGETQRYRIAPATRDRILDAARDAGYRPNYFATALNRQRSATIGILFPNVFESFMSEVVKGIEDVLYPAQYTMVLSTSRFDTAHEQRAIDQFRHRGVDGLLVVPNAPFRGHPHDYSHLEAVVRDHIPIVFVDRHIEGIRCSHVVQDDFRGALNATRALLARGARRPALLSLDIDVSSVRERMRGFDSACRRSGLDPAALPRILLDRRDPLSTDLDQALTAHLRSPRPPDAFFVTTGGIAFKLRHLLLRRGINVGGDIPIARFGADPEFHPSGMLCVVQPHIAMGEQAARILLNAIEHPGARPVHRTLPTALSTPGPTHPKE